MPSGRGQVKRFELRQEEGTSRGSVRECRAMCGSKSGRGKGEVTAGAFQEITPGRVPRPSKPGPRCGGPRPVVLPPWHRLLLGMGSSEMACSPS